MPNTLSQKVSLWSVPILEGSLRISASVTLTLVPLWRAALLPVAPLFTQGQ